MRIIGIDPGIAITGYGIIDKVDNSYKPVTYGKISTEADASTFERLLLLYNNLIEIFAVYHPECAVIEELFFNKNAKTAMVIGQARGVAILAAANSGLEVFEYTPLQVKQAVAGYGRADKKQVQRMVKLLLNLKEVPTPDDVADALAAALCHGSSQKMRTLLDRS
ncbi:MAG: Crossover junction endodeoxyribonuclease RuvC [Firmicutes bacterium]|nr:Crossover junction endodeoxyribonuclease RuvC [Bacillota bacterium]MDI6706639.1 crossover junction endodeoxyribonuclease RuvC [Bacillota bacterium]